MPRKGVRVSAEVWRDRVERWRESGLSSKEFAKQEGIDRPQALSWWANHLRHRDKAEAKPERTSLVRVVKVNEIPSSGGEVDIVLPSGARVAVGPQSNEHALLIALRALGARS